MQVILWIEADDRSPDVQEQMNELFQSLCQLSLQGPGS
jgi:hypothetical protein